MKARVAIVGLGKMGLLHTSILSTLPNVELVALCEKNPMIRRFTKKIFKGAMVVSDVNEFMGLDLDGVYVTTPPSSHFSIVKAIYSKGIARNIFVEKPLASSYAEADELRRLADNRGGVNMVGYNRRFSVTFRKAKEILSEGALGNVVSFEAHAYSSDFFAAKKSPGQSRSRGGVLRDLGCHALDLALWVFVELEVEFAELKPLMNKGSEDSVYIRVRTPKGSGGEFNISWCMENYRLPEVGLQIKGSRGVMKVDDDKVELKLDSGKLTTWYKHDLDDRVFFFLGEAEYSREGELFIKAMLDKCDVEPNFRTASKVDQVIDQVKQRANIND